MRSFGELLVFFTDRAGISDSELARAIGVQRQTIFRWKEGQTSRPRYREDVLRMADKLRLTAAERDELLLAAGFPPQEAQTALVEPRAADAQSPPSSAAAAEMALSDAEHTYAGGLGPEMAPLAPLVLPPAASNDHAARRPPRLVPNPALLLGIAAAIMLAVTAAGYFVLPLVFGPQTTVTPTPVPVVVSVPTNPPTLPSATPTSVVAAPGEKLLLVAPFVGYTSEELRYNVAGRIEEALQLEIKNSKLAGVRVAVLPGPVTAQLQARSVLSATQASALIWGEYDSGRVRANVTVPGEGETDWVNPVESPAKLSVVINEDVPNAARTLALFSLGRLYRQEGDLPTALRAFEQALALKPQESTMLASLHFYAGTLLPKVRGLEVEVLSAAIDHFTQALALKPEWAENVLYNRGTMHLGRGLLSTDERADLDAAVTDLTAVVARQPQGVVPLLNRGIAYYQRRGEGDLAAAIADFSKAVTLAPEDHRGYYHRGLAKIRSGATGWSEDLLKAKALNSQDPSIDNGLCWGYALDGEPQVALPYCEAAVAADPTGSSFDSRAIVYSDLGRNSDAVSDLKQYVLWVQSEHPDLYAKYHGPEAESWIRALEVGENPFTLEVRASLR
jgi:tetratricopeptide (TPR) repeat protein